MGNDRLAAGRRSRTRLLRGRVRDGLLRQTAGAAVGAGIYEAWPERGSKDIPELGSDTSPRSVPHVPTPACSRLTLS